MSRRFRWQFEAEFPAGKIKPQFVRLQSRPISDPEETEVNFLNPPVQTTEPKPQQIATTFIDVAGEDGQQQHAEFYNVLASCYEFTEKSADVVKGHVGKGTLRLFCPEYGFSILDKKDPEITQPPLMNEEGKYQWVCPLTGIIHWSDKPPQPPTPQRPAMGIGILGNYHQRGNNIVNWTELERWDLEGLFPTFIGFGNIGDNSDDIEVTWRCSKVKYTNTYSPQLSK